MDQDSKTSKGIFIHQIRLLKFGTHGRLSMDILIAPYTINNSFSFFYLFNSADITVRKGTGVNPYPSV